MRDVSKIWRKLRFFENLTKIESFSKMIFRKSSPKLRFSKILIKIAILLNLGQTRDIWKSLTSIKIFQQFWPKLRLSEIWTKIEIFQMKSMFFEIFAKTLNFHQFWPKLLFFENFVQNWDFRNFLPKSRYFENLYQNKDFQRFWPKSLLLENFDKNPDISKI